MNQQSYNFRHAEAVLKTKGAWVELHDVVSGLTRDDILDAQDQLAGQRKNAPAGAQTAINLAFKDRLLSLDWKNEPILFPQSESDDVQRAWRMDFLKERIGVEVSFNHAEAIAWTLIRLDIAAQSTEVVESSQIDVGVAIFPTSQLKKWGRMDNAVGTYERAMLWLELMKPVVTTPILLIGIDADWEPTSVFRGTRNG